MVSLRDQTIQALRQEVAEWHGQAQALRAELAEARALLREVEWAEMEGRCGVCQRFRQDGHAPDCRLAAALEGRDESQS